MSALIDGAATPKLTDLAALMTIPKLSKADKRATGRGEIAAHVTGTLSVPDATAKISIRDAALLRRPVPRLDVQANAARSMPTSVSTAKSTASRREAPSISRGRRPAAPFSMGW